MHSQNKISLRISSSPIVTRNILEEIWDGENLVREGSTQDYERM